MEAVFLLLTMAMRALVINPMVAYDQSQWKVTVSWDWNLDKQITLIELSQDHMVENFATCFTGNMLEDILNFFLIPKIIPSHS